MKSKNDIKKNLNSLGIVSDDKKNSEDFETFSKFCYQSVE
jgi:hypothetical protein